MYFRSREQSLILLALQSAGASIIASEKAAGRTDAKEVIESLQSRLAASATFYAQAATSLSVGATARASGAPKAACGACGEVHEDEEESQVFINHYECPSCAGTWQDRWCAQCDDDCPHCGKRHVSPLESEDAV